MLIDRSVMGSPPHHMQTLLPEAWFEGWANRSSKQHRARGDLNDYMWYTCHAACRVLVSSTCVVLFRETKPNLMRSEAGAQEATRWSARCQGKYLLCSRSSKWYWAWAILAHSIFGCSQLEMPSRNAGIDFLIDPHTKLLLLPCTEFDFAQMVSNQTCPSHHLMYQVALTLTDDRTTAELTCCRRGITLSTIFSASLGSLVS